MNFVIFLVMLVFLLFFFFNENHVSYLNKSIVSTFDYGNFLEVLKANFSCRTGLNISNFSHLREAPLSELRLILVGIYNSVLFCFVSVSTTYMIYS